MPVDSRRLDDEGVVIPPTPIHGIEELEGSRSACAAPSAARRPARPARGEPGRRAPHARDRRAARARPSARRDARDPRLCGAPDPRRARRAPDGRYEADDVLEDDLRDADVSLRQPSSRATASCSTSRHRPAGGREPELSALGDQIGVLLRRPGADRSRAPSAGAHRPIEVRAPDGCLLNAGSPAAVAAGNVETSSRVADLVLEALGQATPAQGQGTMNNLTLAGRDSRTTRRRGRPGRVPRRRRPERDPRRDVEHPQHPRRGARERVSSPGARAVGAPGSGGADYRGGDGVVRELEALEPMRFGLITERRRHAPRGREGGEDGARGRNTLNGNPPLEAAGELRPGDRLGSSPRWRRVSIRLATSLTNLGLPRSCSTIRALKRA